MSYTIDRTLHNELRELLEDTVEYFCNENMVSGELTWIIVETLAQAKVAQFKGECQ
jgi:hypothetical protein